MRVDRCGPSEWIVGNTEVEFSANPLSDKSRQIQSVRQVKCGPLLISVHYRLALHLRLENPHEDVLLHVRLGTTQHQWAELTRKRASSSTLGRQIEGSALPGLNEAEPESCLRKMSEISRCVGDFLRNTSHPQQGSRLVFAHEETQHDSDARMLDRRDTTCGRTHSDQTWAFCGVRCGAHYDRDSSCRPYLTASIPSASVLPVVLDLLIILVLVLVVVDAVVLVEVVAGAVVDTVATTTAIDKALILALTLTIGVVLSVMLVLVMPMTLSITIAIALAFSFS